MESGGMVVVEFDDDVIGYMVEGWGGVDIGG